MSDSDRKVVGTHSAKEALLVRSSSEISKVYIRSDWKKSPVLQELYSLAREKNKTPELVSERMLTKIYDHHQGICVFVKTYPTFEFEDLKEQSIILILDSLQDPKNLGAIIRSSWLMGVDVIFIPSRRSAGLTSSVMKAASGGAEHVPVETYDPLTSCVDYLKKIGFWIYSLDAQSKDSIQSEKYGQRSAFILGSEEYGVRSSLKKASDKTLYIPQKDKEASYNVSVASALVLSEYLRQFPIYK